MRKPSLTRFILKTKKVILYVCLEHIHHYAEKTNAQREIVEAAFGHNNYKYIKQEGLLEKS